ncbi:hypothetical protein JCM8097_008570 [Rhodosporidiobolus ruineniae]
MRRLSAAEEHVADVLSSEETVAAKEALQLWELLDDVAVRATSTALNSYPPLARARQAGLRTVLNVVKRRLSAAKQHAANVLSREETIAAEEAVQLWELLDDVAVRVNATALDSVRRERLAQDARFVADGGPLLDPHRPSA